MSQIKLSRAERREMKKLGDRVDKITQADRLFFERFPHRTHRLRYAHRAEIQQEEVLRGGMLVLDPGCRFFIVVRNLCPGSRLRILIGGAVDVEVDDVGEIEARGIFEQFVTPEIRQIERELVAVTCGGRASC